MNYPSVSPTDDRLFMRAVKRHQQRSREPHRVAAQSRYREYNIRLARRRIHRDQALLASGLFVKGKKFNFSPFLF